MKRPPPQPPRNSPEGTTWFGGPIGWFSASVDLIADDLDPDAITRLFSVEPDQSQRKGMPLLKPDGTVKRIPRHGCWSIKLTPKQTDEWDIEQVAWLLLARLPQNIDVWKTIPTSVSVRLSFALSLESVNQGFSVGRELADYVANRNIRLDFHVYADKKAV